MSYKSAGGGIAALGVILVIVGVVLYVYPDNTTLFGYTIYTTYPYRDTGTLLLVLGIILTVVGTIVAVIPGSSSSPPPQLIGEYYQQRIAQTSRSPDMQFCRNCGAQVRTDSVFCEECGKKL
jgi:uncharacterized membrane protein